MSPTNSLENGEIRGKPVKKKTPWRPRDGKYWADEESPSEYKSAQSTKKSSTPVSKKEPTPVIDKEPTPPPAPKAVAPFDKVNAKQRKVFRDIVGRTYVMQDGKKIYVKKLFTPKVVEQKQLVSSPKINTGKVDAKKRKVFKNSKGRTYVKQDNKKVYVKKLLTPKGEIKETKETESSPKINTSKVDAKRRKVFKNSKGRTHVMQNGKKIYVKKLFTPK
jgi:hypothetical protein